MKSSRIRPAAAAVALSAVAVLTAANGANAANWGIQTLVRNDIARGQHWGTVVETGGWLRDHITVKDIYNEGDSIYTNTKVRYWTYSDVTGSRHWSNWGNLTRTEASNNTVTKYNYFGKTANASKAQFEHVLYINLNNMPDQHITELYTTVNY